MKNFLVSRKLEEDYTEAELNPADTCPEHATDSDVNKSIIEKTADKVSRDGDGIEQLDSISEAAQMRLRIATFETIVADAIDDLIDQSDDGVVNEDTVQAEIMPAVDKAVALRKLPASFKNRVPKILLARLRARVVNPRIRFLTKLAARLADEEVSAPEEVTVTEEVQEITPPAEQGGIQVSDPVSIPSEEVDIKEEVVQPDEVEVSSDIPASSAAAMKYLVSATINQRKATALVCKRLASPMAAIALREFKNCLPRISAKKFNM